ncbi:MAG: fibronectin type III domain-containing protein [Proteobacteria bacterium]|nr:fibronectin type III domain-containing protein [Pseudomonadota bacterium]
MIQYVLARDPMGFESNNVVTVLVGPSDTSVTVGKDNLLPGSTYSFRVAVNNSRGLSAFSPQGRFETLSKSG